MAGDHVPLDPKELRLLADILALVLDDEAGQAQAALERLRERARKQDISGGSFKNLIITLADHSEGRTDLLKKRHELEIKRCQEVMEDLSKQHRKLQKYVSYLEKDNQILRFNSNQGDILPWQRIKFILALITGLLTGIAASQIVHDMGSTHKIDRSLCYPKPLSDTIS